MDRLKVYSGRDLCRLLERHGFVEVRRRGSHVVMQRRESTGTGTGTGTDTGTRTVPVPDHPELRIGTLQSIIRQSGLPRDLFETD